MVRVATDIERSWVIATVASKVSGAAAESLRSVVAASPLAQRQALEALSTADLAEHTMDVQTAILALEGTGIDELLRDANLGGIAWSALSSASPAERRRRVMELLANGLDDEHPALAARAREVADATVIEQLLAVWQVWCHPRLQPEYLGLAALARHSLLGADIHDLLVVSMRICDLM